MTEPFYTYVKGEGWVVLDIERVAFTTPQGNWVLENRLPKLGEQYAVFDRDRTEYVTDGKVNLHNFMAYIKEFDPNPMCYPPCQEDTLKYSGYPLKYSGYHNPVFCTIFFNRHD